MDGNIKNLELSDLEQANQLAKKFNDLLLEAASICALILDLQDEYKVVIDKAEAIRDERFALLG